MVLEMPMEMVTQQGYRHKKFDVGRQRELDLSELLIKQELLTRKDTPHSSRSSDEDEESSNCASDYSAVFQLKREREALDSSTPRLKRRRLGEDSGLATNTDLNEPPASTSASQLPHISAATLEDICRYHPNMVRKFPKKERTPKDQERRNKNTIACRTSRRVKKLEHLAIEDQYEKFQAQHLKIVEMSMRATVYFNHLNQLAKRDQVQSPAPAKNFSIDYLIGRVCQH